MLELLENGQVWSGRGHNSCQEDTMDQGPDDARSARPLGPTIMGKGTGYGPGGGSPRNQ